MGNNPEILEASINIKIKQDDLWRLLVSKSTAERITSLTVRTDISDKDGRGNGVLTVGRGIFFVNYTPYDIELNGTQAKIRIRLMELGGGSCAMIACLLSENSILSITRSQLEGYLYNLKTLAEERSFQEESYEEDLGNSKAIHPEHQTSVLQQTIPVSKDENTNQEPHANIGSHANIDSHLKGDYETFSISAKGKRTTEGYPSKERVKKHTTRSRKNSSVEESDILPKHFGRRILVILLLLFMFSTLTLSAFSRYLRISDDSIYSGLSSAVNLKTAQNISFGEKQNQISFIFGSNGVEIGDNRVVYLSTIKEGERNPTERIMIEYSSWNRVKAVSYLNQKTASTYYNLQSFEAEISYDMTVDEAAAKVGIPFSLYRRYLNMSNELIEEIHFGYLDPTANFNSAWRGEYEVVFNRTKQTIVIRNWGPYDGSDPSMRGSLENTPYANQYDDYTDFLNDRYQYSRSQLLLNRYSLGDTKYFFDGEPVHYSNDFGYQFYSIDSADRIGDSDIPIYRISIGYDNKGAFQMASFSNMRLYNKSGTLKDSNYRLLTRGMTYKEVRSLMSLVPTAVYIDADYYSVCYGRFLDTEVTDEQFEVIVRFGIEDNLAHRVLINAAVSEVTDSEKN